MKEMLERTKRVIKDTGSIEKANILLLGVGGVGGYVLEMFVRLGVGSICVVDCDKFDKTNLNRQLLATTETIGRKKVLVAKERALSINPEIKIKTISQKISPDNVSSIITTGYDYVVDAIDDVAAKVAVIKYCKDNNIPCISAMGTGNRYKMPQFVVEDIFKTSYDGLAKKMRMELKKLGINKGVIVVYTKEQAEKTEGLGSVIYYPLMCAGTIASFVTNALITK